MADRVALYLQDAHPLADAIEYVQYAELCGFEAVWQAESRLVRDAIVPMAAFAAVTSRIKIGSGVINNWTRNAAVIAATFLTLWTIWPRTASIAASAPGGTRLRPRSASSAARTCSPCARSSPWSGAC